MKAIEYFEKENIDPILLILSSDHYIENLNEFKRSIENSIELAEAGNLIIFGVIPTKPATGYGYIKAKNRIKKGNYIANKLKSLLKNQT